MVVLRSQATAEHDQGQVYLAESVQGMCQVLVRLNRAELVPRGALRDEERPCLWIARGRLPELVEDRLQRRQRPLPGHAHPGDDQVKRAVEVVDGDLALVHRCPSRVERTASAVTAEVLDRRVS